MNIIKNVLSFDKDDYLQDPNEELEVIGNIYDYPELLEVDE